ncbi:MAG: XisI protein [Coleofasciculus sp. D1-CHI-01]|uniref:element excision factor XisI family protein n=1 Tax=Coleofasciculus sp. D1-CHI-01 TaxID=3068482 RepID=UPI0032F5AA5C
MDTLKKHSQIVQDVLKQYTHLSYAYGEIQNEAVFDRETNRYLIVSVGWGNDRRIHGCLIHVDIIDGKVWIQRDGTEDGIANELVQAGIPKDYIVLGFHEPSVRQYTGYAVA